MVIEGDDVGRVGGCAVDLRSLFVGGSRREKGERMNEF